MTIQKYSSLLTAALVSLSLVMSSTTMAQAQSNQRMYSPMADNLGSNINVILSDEVPFEESETDFRFVIMLLDNANSESKSQNPNDQFLHTVRNRIPVQCRGTLDQPHRSFHQPGRVNAQSRIKCQVPMKELNGEVKLSRVGITTVSSGVKTVQNRKNWTANASIACDGVQRLYRSSVTVNWIAPEGFEPPSGKINFQKEAAVKC